MSVIIVLFIASAILNVILVVLWLYTRYRFKNGIYLENKELKSKVERYRDAVMSHPKHFLTSKEQGVIIEELLNRPIDI